MNRVVIACACLILGSTVAASAQPAPIRIQACTVLRWQPVGAGPFWHPFPYPALGPGVPVTDGIEIDYVNTSAVTADRVQFEVNYRGQVDRITDAGTFSPGALIKHTFANFSGLAYLGPTPDYCRVRLARFVNGTVYIAP